MLCTRGGWTGGGRGISGRWWIIGERRHSKRKERDRCHHHRAFERACCHVRVLLTSSMHAQRPPNVRAKSPHRSPRVPPPPWVRDEMKSMISARFAKKSRLPDGT